VITLEAPETVHAGEPIEGVVRGAERVRLFVRRTADWNGARDSAVTRDKEGVVVEAGTFVLPAVQGPLTFRGEHAEVRWSIVAEAQGGARDRVERPFELVAPLTTTYEREAAGGYRDRPTETTTLEPYFGKHHVEGPRREEASATEPLALLAGKLSTFFTSIMGGRTGASNVTLDVTPSRVRGGDEIVAKLSFITSEETVVESITVELVAREYWGAARGPNIESHAVTVTERVRLVPAPHDYEARLKIPAAATPSWAISYVGVMGVEWFVRATILIDGVADNVSEFVIGVAPF